MLTTLLVRLVAWSVRRPILVVVLSLLIAAFAGVYTVQHFKINTDVSKLIDNEPQWAALGKAVDDAFPQRSQTLLAVVEAPAPEFASAAADALAAALDKDTQAGRIGQVSLPAGGPLFERDALLFLSPAELAKTTSKLADARPLVNTLAKDPSVTGLATTLSTTLGQPLLTGQVTLPGMKTLLGRAAASVDDVLAGRPAAFSWRALVDSDAAKQPAFAFVTVEPMVNYGALKAGEQTERTIRETAASLQLDKRFGAVVRLTGEQPLADEEFASVQDGAALNGIGTLIVVLIILVAGAALQAHDRRGADHAGGGPGGDGRAGPGDGRLAEHDLGGLHGAVRRARRRFRDPVRREVPRGTASRPEPRSRAAGRRAFDGRAALAGHRRGGRELLLVPADRRPPIAASRSWA